VEQRAPVLAGGDAGERAKEVAAWVRSDEGGWPLSFVNICGLFGLDVAGARRRILDGAATTPARFDAFARWVNGQIARGVRPGPMLWMVLLDSPGGNVAASMALGDLLRQGNWNTATGVAYGTGVATCASACVYSFAGGRNRLMFGDGTLVVHQFAFPRGAGSAATAQVTTAVINLYLDRMDISRVLQDVAGVTPTSTGTALTRTDALTLQLAYLTPELRAALTRAAGASR
jgi:hypothetical protein